jgi:hypothetical protein
VAKHGIVEARISILANAIAVEAEATGQSDKCEGLSSVPVRSAARPRGGESIQASCRLMHRGGRRWQGPSEKRPVSFRIDAKTELTADELWGRVSFACRVESPIGCSGRPSAS